ncbi:MAG: hypothetical protein NUW23_05565 [Firmicutes bacterium]|jgi:DNA-binding response OmpR family regulator|nr:hypothetical protein [Bacillota bacterium]
MGTGEVRVTTYLIAESDPAVRTVLAEYLRGWDSRNHPYVVECLPRQVPDLLDRLRPKAVAIDITFAARSELEALARMCERTGGTRLVLMCSEESNDASRTDLGTNLVLLQKPFGLRAFRQAVGLAHSDTSSNS